METLIVEKNNLGNNIGKGKSNISHLRRTGSQTATKHDRTFLIFCFFAYSLNIDHFVINI